MNVVHNNIIVESNFFNEIFMGHWDIVVVKKDEIKVKERDYIILEDKNTKKEMARVVTSILDDGRYLLLTVG